MGDYVIVTDVESLIGDADFTNTSTPTTSEVKQFITWVEGEVNARLFQLGFDVPVTATESKKLLETTVLWGVGALTLEAMSAMGGGDAENVRLERWWKFYDRAVDLIVGGGGEVLYDADRTTTPRPNTLPTVYGDETSESVDHNLTFRQLAAKTQYLDRVAVSRITSPWKGALSRVR